MKKILLFILALILSGIQISCEKSFLDLGAVGSLDESILNSVNGVNSLLIGCYATLNDGTHYGPDMLCYGGIKGGELFKGSDPGDQPAMLEAVIQQWSTGGSYVGGPWRSFYSSIDRCNTVLKWVNKVDGFTDAQKVQIQAEARFIRAHYYFKLKILYLHIPWLDETTTPITGIKSTDYDIPNTVGNDGVTWVDCWPQILADMDFARKNLPATQTSANLARPNKWAADIYYAKMLMYTAGYYGEGAAAYANGYVDALPILTNAIANGRTSNNLPYALLANYHDNFDAAYENGAESVYAVQLSVNDYQAGAGGNGNAASTYIGSNNKYGPSLGRGWGFYTPTPYWADHFRVDGKGLPYLDMFATNSHRLKHDQGLLGAPAAPAPDPFVRDTVGVDPRLDWSISRRGIPLLDYGDFPGRSWQRNQDHAGPYMAKKVYIWKSQSGTYTPSPSGSSSSTANNLYIIRFSDVLLLAAECEARVGSLANARALVNQVRQRMRTNTGSYRNWVKRPYNGTVNAANYRIGLYPATGAFSTKAGALDAILMERTLELGMEGSRFFDLVRFEKAEKELNEFIAVDQILFDYLKGAVYTTVPDAYLPIPQTAIDNSQKEGKVTLTQNPGY